MYSLPTGWGDRVPTRLNDAFDEKRAVDIFVGVPPTKAATFIVIIPPTLLQDPGLAAYIRACAARSVHRMFIIMPYVAWAKLVGV